MAWFLAAAARRLGWRVTAFDDRAYVRCRLPGTPGKALQALERDYGWPGRHRGLGRHLRRLAQHCDLAVSVKGEYLRPQDVSAISAMVPFFNWHPDHALLDQQLAAVPHYTAFCPKDSWTTTRLQAMGFDNVMTLPHASDPDLLGGLTTTSCPGRVTIVGSMYPYRAHWVEQVRQAGLSIEVFGSSRDARSLPGVSSVHPAVHGRAQGLALRHGLFTLNTHHPKDIAGANQRLFDAAAAGAPQITEDLPDSLEHFLPGDEILTFDGVDTLVAAIDELRRSPALRTRLARNSQARVREEHTYEHRLQALVTLASAEKPHESPRV